tara:strand:- start:833 stop:1717 length:885 start_codon:yes stop_codon:yes gene_type:complete
MEYRTNAGGIIIKSKDVYTCIVNHNAGFFSNCTICLVDLIECINHLNDTNIELDTTNTFKLYKNAEKNGNIGPEYLKKTDNDKEIDIIYEKIENGISLLPYKNLNFSKINPYISKYFLPCDQITNIINLMEKKYKIDYDNTCCVFFRGLDKFVETDIPKYDMFCNKILSITKEKDNIRYLLQTDETEFFDYAKNIFNNNLIFYDEIRHMKHSKTLLEYSLDKNENFKYSLYFFAIVIIMSKCKYVVCNSSNVSLWISLFRGNTNNLHQYLKQIPKFNNLCKNILYDESVKDVWY